MSRGLSFDTYVCTYLGSGTDDPQTKNRTPPVCKFRYFEVATIRSSSRPTSSSIFHPQPIKINLVFSKISPTKLRTTRL